MCHNYFSIAPPLFTLSPFSYLLYHVPNWYTPKLPTPRAPNEVTCEVSVTSICPLTVRKQKTIVDPCFDISCTGKVTFSTIPLITSSGL